MNEEKLIVVQFLRCWTAAGKIGKWKGWDEIGGGGGGCAMELKLHLPTGGGVSW